MGAIEKLKEYKNNSHDINQSLREGSDNPNLNAIDVLFSEIEVPSILYRLLDNQFVKIIGDVFCDPAYLSCTDDIDYFICKTDPTNHLACMAIKMTSPSLSINVTKMLPEYDGEGEYLLPRETKLKLVESKDFNGIAEFDEFLESFNLNTGSDELWGNGIKIITLYTFVIVD